MNKNLNRQGRRKEAWEENRKMYRGTQDSHIPTGMIKYQEIVKKSRAGVSYTHYIKVLSTILNIEKNEKRTV